MRRSSLIVFLMGFVVGAMFFYLLTFSSGYEVPFISGMVVSTDSAPGDHLAEQDIVVFDDYVLIKVEGATVSRYAPTGSMKPVLDTGANGIRIVPESVDDINVGDVVSFRKSGRLIVHRVVDKGVDSEGVYFVTRGDNNGLSDGKVRFEDIEYITVGILW